MASTSSVSSALSDIYTGKKASTAKSTLDMQDFLHLLTEQLSNQNPLEPMNDRDFFAQMAQLGQVQGMDKLTGDSEVQQIQNMMGKQVTALRPMTEGKTGTNDIITGTAVKMKVVNGERYVVLRQADGGEVDIKPEQIQSIRDVPKAADYTSLIGKTTEVPVLNEVTNLYESAKGTIQSVGVKDSQVMVTVATEKGKVTVALDSLTSIAGG